MSIFAALLSVVVAAFVAWNIARLKEPPAVSYIALMIFAGLPLALLLRQELASLTLKTPDGQWELVREEVAQVGNDLKTTKEQLSKRVETVTENTENLRRSIVNASAGYPAVFVASVRYAEDACFRGQNFGDNPGRVLVRFQYGRRDSPGQWSETEEIPLSPRSILRWNGRSIDVRMSSADATKVRAKQTALGKALSGEGEVFIDGYHIDYVIERKDGERGITEHRRGEVPRRPDPASSLTSRCSGPATAQVD